MVTRMRINGVNNIDQVYKSKKTSKAYNAQGVESSKDVVTLSNFAKDLSVAKKAVNQTPDVRMERVNSLKAQIEAGEYNISASQIAEKMLEQSRGL
jgi:negative regulator of flagellin synthesis FlgM